MKYQTINGWTKAQIIKAIETANEGRVSTLEIRRSRICSDRPRRTKFKLSLPDGYGIAPHALGQGVLGRTEPFKCTQHTPVTYGTRRGYCSVCDASLEMINFEWREVVEPTSVGGVRA